MILKLTIVEFYWNKCKAYHELLLEQQKVMQKLTIAPCFEHIMFAEFYCHNFLLILIPLLRYPVRF